ncbi:hypothetical protein VU03_04350, partial [Desulfobulbus sp. N3]|nr:hypothetical protein [Desulfobulbus sp. N3]
GLVVIGDWINRVLTSGEEEAIQVRQEVRQLCETVPLYPEIARMIRSKMLFILAFIFFLSPLLTL